MTTVSETNISEIPDIIDTVVKHKVDVFAFARYCPIKRQQEVRSTNFLFAGEKETGMTTQKYRTLLDTCYAKFKAYEAAGCETYFNLKDHLWTLYLYEKGIFKIPESAEPDMIYGGCNCGSCHLTILPTGDIYACRRLKSRVGNVFTDRIADVWIGKNMESYREYGKKVQR